MEKNVNIIDDFSDCVLTPEMKAKVIKEDLELTAYFNSCKKEQTEGKTDHFDDCVLSSSTIKAVEEENFDDCALSSSDTKIREEDSFEDCMKDNSIGNIEDNFEDCKKGVK